MENVRNKKRYDRYTRHLLVWRILSNPVMKRPIECLIFVTVDISFQAVRTSPTFRHFDQPSLTCLPPLFFILSDEDEHCRL